MSWAPTSSLFRQTWVISEVLISIVGQGTVLGYTSCLIPALKAPDSPIKIDINSASWLVSIVGPSYIVGAVVTCILMNYYGRRPAFLVTILPGVLGWVIIFAAQSYTILLIGRILTGIGAGLAVPLGAVIIAEYASPIHRGMFLNLKIVSTNLGSTIAHILGSYFHWRTIAGWAFVPYVISFVIACTSPESPAWLASKKQFRKSREAFFWLRGHSEDAQLELDEMLKAQETKLNDENLSIYDRILNFMQKFTRKDFLKPLFIAIACSLLIEVAGRHIFTAFAAEIMADVTGNNTQPRYYMLAVDLIITASALFSSVLIRLFKRRTMLFTSGITSLTVLFSACLYVFLVSGHVLSEDYPWIAVSLFVLYFLVVNLGCTSIPLALLGELFPLEHRGAGTAIVTAIASIFLTGILHITPYLLLSLKIYGTFSVFGCIMALTLLFLYIILPETKDRTLQEIEDYFNDGKFKDRIQDEAHSKMISRETE